MNAHRPDREAERLPAVPAAIRGLIIKALGGALTIVVLAILSSPAAASASTISCSPGSVIVGQSTTCTAMETDHSTSYSFTTDGQGSFTPSSSCNVGKSVACSVSYVPSAVGKGAHTITATSNRCAPNGTVLPGCPLMTVVTVTGRPTSTAVACAPGAVVVGQSTTCTATVTEAKAAGVATASPTGTVSFASSPAGGFGGGSSCVLSANRTSAGCAVTFTPSAVGPGVNTVTATYRGDMQYAGASGSALVTVTAPVTVPPPVTAPAPPPVIPPAKDSSVTIVSCSPGTVAVGHATTCAATVSDVAGPTPTGTVSFATSGAGSFGPGASCVLSGIEASSHCSVTFTPTHAASATVTITAAYSGDFAHTGGSGLTTVAFPPAAGVTANVTVIQGVVLISEPSSGHAHTASESTAGGSLVPLKGSTTAVPVGSTIDARKGTIEMATAADYRGAVDPRHRLQTGVFSAGMFTIQQMTARQALVVAKRQHKRRATGIPATNLRLTNNSNALMAARCRRSGAPGRGIVRSIHGVANGLFATIGAASITTVHNATWTVEDRCDGTLTEVGRGRATVASPMHLHQRTVTVKAGEAYLVTARFLEGPRKGIRPR
jgi:Bacterial Ig-like domain (group 3)